MSDEMPVAATAEVAPSAVTPENGMQAAPGCETPKAERIKFPKLVSAGGKFRSVPAADGSVHFDVNLVPKIEVDGKQVPGSAPWPRSVGEDGKPMPLPWEGHSRATHLALTKDCFDTTQGYFLYRAHEAYENYLTALDNYTDAVNGVAKASDQKAKKTEQVLNGLTAMAAGLSEADKKKVEEVLAMLANMKNAPIGG